MFREKREREERERSIEKSFRTEQPTPKLFVQLLSLSLSLSAIRSAQCSMAEGGEGYITLCERHFVFDKHNWRLSAEERERGERD